MAVKPSLAGRLLIYLAVMLLVYTFVHTAAGAPVMPVEPPFLEWTVPQQTAQVVALQQENQQLRRQNVKQRRQLESSRRALHTVIHSPAYGNGTSWIEKAFLCIHSFEGSWTDPNAPYWGGVQMDLSFMRSYAPWAVSVWGTADRWPVSVQLSAAIRAFYSGRGFWPWPNTARYCGLL